MEANKRYYYFAWFVCKRDLKVRSVKMESYDCYQEEVDLYGADKVHAEILQPGGFKLSDVIAFRMFTFDSEEKRDNFVESGTVEFSQEEEDAIVARTSEILTAKNLN